MSISGANTDSSCLRPYQLSSACVVSAAAPPVEDAVAGLPQKHLLPPAPGPPPKRSKKGKKAKNGNKAVIPELNPSDYVRVVKVTNREDLLHEGPVLLSKVDKAGQMVLSEDRLTVTSSKGYRMVSGPCLPVELQSCASSAAT